MSSVSGAFLSPIELIPSEPVENFTQMTLEQIEGTRKYREILAALKRVDKSEIHVHLGGAVSMAFMQKHMAAQAYNNLTEFIDRFSGGMDYREGFKAFSLISAILDSNQRIEEAAFDFCQKLHSEQITFCELRTGLKRLDGGFENYLQSVINGLRRGMATYSFVEVTLVISLRRDTSIEDANEAINLAIKYREQGVTGIDVSGESTKGDGHGIFEALQLAKDNGLPVTLHLGESAEETEEQQLKELTLIQPKRVGHAVHLSPEAKAWIEENQTVVEVCLRSAVSVRMIDRPGEHPGLALYKKGHPVVFCSDDPTLFGTLSEELALAACLCNLSIPEAAALQEKAKLHAFSLNDRDT